MKRFYFDYTTQGQSLLDYRGHEFRSPQSALEFAEATVHDLMHSLSENWNGWSVEVRNAEGEKFYAIPVQCR